MMETIEKLAGFDLREMWLPLPSERFSHHPPGTFELKSPIEKPLSTDGAIWPSVFDGIHLDDDNNALPLPDWPGGIYRTWASLSQLENTVRRHWGAHGKPSWVIAITSFPGLFDERDRAMWKVADYPVVWPTDPAQIDPTWELLGYDISDVSLLNGLSNCGYYDAEKRVLGEQFGNDLNKWHLFTDPARAFEFKKVTDKRVTEHAPFFVFGLYLIRQHHPS